MVGSHRGKFGRRRFWEKHVSAWNKTELSQADYCRLNKISRSSFHYWKNRIVPSGPLALVEIPVVSPAPVSISHCSAQICVVVDRYRVEIRKGFDPEELERVLGVLGRL